MVIHLNQETIMIRSSRIAVAALALAITPAAWAANSITAITPEANRVALVDGKATVRFMLSGQGNEQSDCGVWVSYGDNDSPDTRVIGRQEGAFPREFVHTFSRPGNYTVTAKGERVKQTFGCAGQASATITVVENTRPRRQAAAAAAACPDGWQLREGSFDRRTGAFICIAAFPAQAMECGAGLRYFQRDSLIGCRARGAGTQR